MTHHAIDASLKGWEVGRGRVEEVDCSLLTIIRYSWSRSFGNWNADRVKHLRQLQSSVAEIVYVKPPQQWILGKQQQCSWGRSNFWSFAPCFAQCNPKYCHALPIVCNRLQEQAKYNLLGWSHFNLDSQNDKSCYADWNRVIFWNLFQLAMLSSLQTVGCDKPVGDPSLKYIISN